MERYNSETLKVGVTGVGVAVTGPLLCKWYREKEGQACSCFACVQKARAEFGFDGQLMKWQM